MTRPPIGANTWIWTSPVTDEQLVDLVPRLSQWGFDLIELPIENLTDWDPERTAELLKEHGLGASICIALSAAKTTGYFALMSNGVNPGLVRPKLDAIAAQLGRCGCH